MGGNALSFESSRLDKADYERVEKSVVQRLRAALPDCRVGAIEAYREKPSFGDLDVLVSSLGYDPFVAARAIDAVEVVRNGPVTSVGVAIDPQIGAVNGNVFQVDFISIAPESFSYGFQYFRMNDAGNLFGRIAHKMGLVHGHAGLSMMLRDGDHKFGEIELTRDYAKALAFMGYESKAFLDGLDTLPEMFDFVASTPFFNPTIYLLENRNNASRIRDRKRPTYNAFLKWCEERAGLGAYDHGRDKSIWHARIQTHFPHFAQEHALALAALERNRAAQARFNGAFVSQASGLTGKELGGLMQRIRGEFEGDALKSFVLLASDQDLLDLVERVSRVGRAGEPATRSSPRP